MTLRTLIEAAREGADGGSRDEKDRVRAKLSARLSADAAPRMLRRHTLRRGRAATVLLVAAAVLIVGTASALAGREILRTREHDAQAARAAAANATPPPPVATTPAMGGMPDNPAPAEALPASPRPVRKAPAPAPPAPSARALDAEMALLQEARDALRLRDPSSALSALARYDESFRSGVLKPEAAALRVFALCDAGRTAEARARGVVFAKQWPRSPLTVRLRESCAFDRSGEKAP